MTLNLLALCGSPGDATVKRVRTSAEVQERLAVVFQVLENQFRTGVEQERAYDSRWFPPAEELTTLPVSNEVTHIINRVGAGVLALDEIDVGAFEAEQIRALAVYRTDHGNARLVVQRFTAAQRLSRRVFTLIANGNEFDELSSSSFTLSGHIDALVEGGLIKFKSYHVAKSLFDLSAHYREATDQDIRDFCDSNVVQADADALIAAATQPIRKLISSIQASGLLEAKTADELRQRGQGLVDIVVQDGRVVLPTAKRELRDMMAFFDHKIYWSPVTDDPFETNSHRRR